MTLVYSLHQLYLIADHFTFCILILKCIRYKDDINRRDTLIRRLSDDIQRLEADVNAKEKEIELLQEQLKQQNEELKAAAMERYAYGVYSIYSL